MTISNGIIDVRGPSIKGFHVALREKILLSSYAHNAINTTPGHISTFNIPDSSSDTA